MSGNKLVDLLNTYNHEHTVLETGKVLTIKAITTGQMKSILQYEGNDDISVIDDVLDDIINGCVITEGFDVNELTLQDRFDLLIGIRKVSKGSSYTFTIKCPQCKSESIQGIDIDDLKVVPFSQTAERSVKVGTNLTLNLNYVRRKHQKEAVALANQMGDLTDTQRRSEVATFMYAFGLDDVRTNQGSVKDISIQDKKEFLDNLSATDYETINDWYKKNNYGTEFKYNVVCKSKCGFSKEEDVPLTGFFF